MATTVVYPIRPTHAISSVVRASNVTTVTLSAAWSNNNLQAGQYVNITGVTDATFNVGVVEVASVTSQTVFTYANTGTDGSSSSGSAGGFYDNVEDWNTYEAANITAAGTDEIHRVKVYDDGHSGSTAPWSADGLLCELTLSGWTSDSSNPIIIEAGEGNRTTGVPGTGAKLYLSTSTAYNYDEIIATQSDAYVVIDGLEFDQKNTAKGGYCVYMFGPGVVKNCIATQNTNYYAFHTTNIDAVFYNCLAYDCFRGFGSTNYEMPDTYNCTAIDCATGFRIYSSNTIEHYFKNNTAFGNTTNFEIINIGDAVADYNATEDSTAPTGFTNTVLNIASTDFNDYANDDFHLSGLSSNLHAAGANLDTIFTTDIDGDTRPSSPTAWGIGFDEYVSAGGTTTMDADYATFALTGQVADLSRAFILAAAQGGYTLTGQPAGLAKAFILSAENGVFTLNGQDAGLFFTFVMPAASAIYASTGYDAELTKGFIMEALTGSFIMSGQDTTLLAELVLQAAQGDYALTGSATDFSKAFIMAADTGTYVATGQNAGLLASRLLDLAGGNYSLTANDALLGKVFVITAIGGSYSLSPQDANLIADRLLSGEYALYELIVQDASFVYSGSPVGEIAQISVLLKERTITFSLVANN